MGYTGNWQTEWAKSDAGEMKRTYGGRHVTVLPTGVVWAKTSTKNNIVHTAESLKAGMAWADERYAL